MPQPKKKKTREEILAQKRENERKRYERIKNDPNKLATLKEKKKQYYSKARTTGKIKTISEMSDREKRLCRKSWRARSSKYYKKKCAAKKTATNFIRANTPSSLCSEDLICEPSSSQILHSPLQELSFSQSPRLRVARQKSVIQRRKRNKEIKEKDDKIKKLQAELNKYRKKVSKLRKKKNNLKKQLTPNSKMSQMADDPTTRNEVVKKALFGDNIEKQIIENLKNIKTRQEKEISNKLILGSIVKESKVWKTNNKVITYKKIWNAERQKKEKVGGRLRKSIEEFMEDDKYSRLGAGKKEYITKNKIRKQRRYRLDTLRNLHKEFLKTRYVVSYSTFARLAPFWVVAPKVTDRDTCMCTLHSNFQLIVTALNKVAILQSTTYQNLLATLCCDRYNERCLDRTCDSCCTKSIPLCEEFDQAMAVKYQEWVAKREVITDPKTKKDRTIVKQKKITTESSVRELLKKLKDDLKTLFNHEKNIVHQYQSMKSLKESLTEKDAVVHMDFSENYSTKYNEEIQSFHFGGSRMQISLHTVVVYLQNSTRSYCTVSTNLSHNVYAIWAHLQPVLEELPASIENIHFLSDGPVTQYRNKLMFYVLACKLTEMWPNFISWSWNYHEAGHGKGAPDGVGATCKRTADSVVASGHDVSNLTQFCGAIQSRCPNITLFTITDSDIEKMEVLISKKQPNLLSFNGTLKVHQVQGNAYFPKKVMMKSLSCFCSNECEHFRLGVLVYSTPIANVDDIFDQTDSERDDARSHSIINPLDMDDNLSRTSDLTLNIDDPDGLLSDPVLNIDPEDLFPKNERRLKRKRKPNDKRQLHQGEEIKNNNTAKTHPQKKKPRTNVKNKRHERDSDDCYCIICGLFYKEDTTGQDWVQCIICHQWAQMNCIKTDLVSFTCPNCLLDKDYAIHS